MRRGRAVEPLIPGMSVRSLCINPDRILRVPAGRVDTFTEELRRLARDMLDTMYANDGVGLAAPQVGSSLQVFVINPSQQPGRELVLVNPVLEHASGRSTTTEGCLSLPKVWSKVRRAAQVRVRGQDLAGGPLLVEGEGLLAIVLQHELDHLQGKLFIDRLPWYRRPRLRTRSSPDGRGADLGARGASGR